MPPKKPSSEESVVAGVLKAGYATLRFPEPLETEFRRHHQLSQKRWVRLALLIVIGTSIGFWFMDHFVIHATRTLPNLVRFGLQIPILIILVLATNKRFYMSGYQTYMQIGAPLFGAGTILLAVYAPTEHTALVGARLMLVAFFLYFMAGLRMKQALFCNLTVLVLLFAAGGTGMIASEVAAYMSFAMVCANVIGSAGAYALEHANRTSFLERRLLVEIAELDGLTRLLNRQTFETRVQDAWRRAITERRAVTVIMVDVDHFKLYNDSYGHQAGDECLRKVSAAVRSAIQMRPGDFVARYGGEEIIAVLSDRSTADAKEIAHRIVEEVAALEIPHSSTHCARVSVSVGAATQLAPITSSYDAIVRLADGALYTAKRQGRNQCVAVEARAVAA